MGGAAMRVATQTAFDSYARYYVESFRLPTMSKQAVDEGLHQGRDCTEHILQALERGNGVIARCRTWGAGSGQAGGGRTTAKRL